MVFFEKTYPAPKSLEVEFKKANGSYKELDVLEQLHSDFKNKCYICESKGIESINIEHFAPHKNQNKIRKFNWSNLFWACSHCNQIKSDREPFLNSILKGDTVDVNIKYLLNDDFSKNQVVIEAISNDIKTQNTAQLLKDIYSGTTMQNKFQAREKRNRLYDEMCDFTNLISKYFRTEDREKKEELLITIKYELSNKSAFTAFKRCFIKENSKFNSLVKYTQ